MNQKNNFRVAIKYFLLVIFAIITVFPFYWMISSSLKSGFEVIQTPPTMLPEKVMWSNYSTAFSMAPFGRYFINTIIVTALSIISTVVISILSAFAFSHLEFKGRDLIFSIFIPPKVTWLKSLLKPEISNLKFFKASINLFFCFLLILLN